MDCDRYKLFVGGIPRETSEESLKLHFSRYGAVLGAVVAKEKATGHPRGFGFVRFANAYDVDKALRDTHYILGRAVDVKIAIPKHEQMRYQQPNVQPYVSEVQQNNGGLHEISSNGNNNHRTKKLFVGGLSSETTEEEFKTYFEKFGRTTDVVVMHDSVTNRPRGFGFVTYDSENSVEIVMQSNFHELSNKRVEVKRAIPKEEIQSNNGSNHNLPTTYSSFQATPYVPERNGYGMLVQYPPVFGYHQGVQGFHYPYGYPVTAQGPNVPWNNQIMPPTTAFYCPPPPPPPPPTNTHCYLPYMNGFDLCGPSVTPFNAVPWPVPGDGAGVIIPRLEDLKLQVPSQVHKRMNGGNMRKPLPNGTCR